MKLTTHGLRTRAYATDPSPGPHVAIDAFPSLPSDSYSISAIWPNTADLELVVKADSDVFVQVKLVGSDPAPFVRTLTVLATADPEKWNRVVAFWRDHAYGYEYLEKLASVLRSHGLSYGKMRVSRTQEATCRAW